ncbi:MAG: hypothetical protein KKF30_03200 [Proteobacteria bacterium]|nr:hypothetical protein [Pseudomonadota bacterium]MBU4471352.1 hypothetical protein [Pseudomonadota bacterium]MCG2751645.1 hypothetical protein [Desulfobacteraceae bacterium]
MSAATTEEIYAIIGFGFKDSHSFPMKMQGSYSDAEGWPMRTCIRTSHFRLDKNIKINGSACGEEKKDIFLANICQDQDERINLANHPNYHEIRNELEKKVDDRFKDLKTCPEEYVKFPEHFLALKGQMKKYF